MTTDYKFVYPAEFLVRNAIETPDGTVLESTHRHHCATHTDAVDGNFYMVDGGLSYQRAAGAVLKQRSVWTSDHMVARQYLKWGTRGKFGDQPIEYKKIMDLETEHIEAILEDVPNIMTQIYVCLMFELMYRKLVQ